MTYGVTGLVHSSVTTSEQKRGQVNYLWSWERLKGGSSSVAIDILGVHVGVGASLYAEDV